MEGKFSGFIIEASGQRSPASLNISPETITLTVVSEGHLDELLSLKPLDRVFFQGPVKSFSLFHLRPSGAHGALAGHLERTFQVWVAIPDVHIDAGEELCSSNWMFYVDGLHKVLPNFGIAMSVDQDESGKTLYSINYSKPNELILPCGDQAFELAFVEEATLSFPTEAGASIATRQAMVIKFQSPVEISYALEHADQIRKLFTLLLGYNVSIRGGKISLDLDEKKKLCGYFGPFKSVRAGRELPSALVALDAERLGSAIGKLFKDKERFREPIDLHIDGMSHLNSSATRRFQSLIQSIEGFHRRSFTPAPRPFKTKDLRAALRTINGMQEEWVEKVINACTHVNEPSLRERMEAVISKSCLDIESLFPQVERNGGIRKYLGRIAATRNYLAHRMLPGEEILEGIELHDACEFLKVVSHANLFSELAISTEGLGQSMRQNRYIELSVNGS